MAETLDTKFLNDCQILLNIFKVDPKYNSSNPRLKISALEAHLATGMPITREIPVRLAPQKLLINARQEINEEILNFAKRSRRYLKSSGASEADIDDGQSYLKPILGGSRPKPATENTDMKADKAIETYARILRSNAAILAALIAYREFINNLAVYNPNEAETKVSTADALIEQAQETTEAINAGFAALSKAWNDRDEKLYTDEFSILNDFRAAKEYYKSLYDAKDPEYRSVTAVQLKDNSREGK